MKPVQTGIAAVRPDLIGFAFADLIIETSQDDGVNGFTRFGVCLLRHAGEPEISAYEPTDDYIATLLDALWKCRLMRTTALCHDGRRRTLRCAVPPLFVPALWSLH